MESKEEKRERRPLEREEHERTVLERAEGEDRLTTEPLEREYRDIEGFSQCTSIVRDGRLNAILQTLLTHTHTHRNNT